MNKIITAFRHSAMLGTALSGVLALASCSDDSLSSASDPTPTDTGNAGVYDPAPVRTPLSLVTDPASTVNGEPAASNITVSSGAVGAYTLDIDGTDPGDIYIFTRPLDADLTQTNVCLTFMYRTDAHIPRLSLAYYNPEANDAVARGEIKPVSQVDTDAEGYALARFIISGDLIDYGWGHAGDRLKIFLRPEQTARCSMLIKDIYLECTDIPQGESGSADLNIYPLTFTPGRGAWWDMENAYGIYSGVNFSRNKNTYTLFFDDSYNESGSAVEHFIGSDPLTRVLSYDNTNKIEVQFRYRASSAFTLRTGLYPFNDPGSDWPASIRDSKVPASASVETDKDGFAFFAHDISSAVRQKGWGRVVEGMDQQIRFTFQGADGSSHPETSGLTQLELKDVCVVVSDRDADEMEAIDLILEVPGYRKPDVTSMTVTDGEYDIHFAGEFPAQEYELFTSEIPQALDPAKEYYFQMEYMCEEEINSFQLLYFAKNGGGDNQWASAKGDLVPTDKWTRVTLPLSDRLAHGNWGASAGQVLRPHFYDIPGRTESGRVNFGKPLSVKVRNVRIVAF